MSCQSARQYARSQDFSWIKRHLCRGFLILDNLFESPGELSHPLFKKKSLSDMLVIPLSAPGSAEQLGDVPAGSTPRLPRSAALQPFLRGLRCCLLSPLAPRHQFSLQGERAILLLLKKKKNVWPPAKPWNKCASLPCCLAYS